MKKNNYNITVFFIACGLGAIYMLKQNMYNSIIKIFIASLFFGLVSTIAYVIFKRPLSLLYRRNFDKNYKYNTFRSKKK